MMRVLKFGVVGVVNNAIGYAIFVVLSLTGVGYVGAMTISYLVGMGISFLGNRAWTFGHSGPVWPTVVRFVAANVTGYGVNLLVLHFLVVAAGMAQIPAQLVATAFVAVCTFSLMRLWVFPRSEGAAPGVEA